MAFALTVDDFLINYHKQEDEDHLHGENHKICRHHDQIQQSKANHYTQYARLYHESTQRFEKYVKGADSPLMLYYSAKTQLAAAEDKSAPMSAAEIKVVQEIVGIFFFYAWSVDLTMVISISTITSKQAKPTQMLKSEIAWFLQYASKRRSWIDHLSEQISLDGALWCILFEQTRGQIEGRRIHLFGRGPNDIAMNVPNSVVSVIISTVVSSARSRICSTIYRGTNRNKHPKYVARFRIPARYI